MGTSSSSEMKPELKNWIDGKISGKKIMIFSKSYCPYCRKAKEVMKKLISEGEIDADEVDIEEIENHSDAESIQQYLKQITGSRSVPRVFVKGKCIGGGDDCQAAYSSGKLKKLLK